jgi:DNA-binding LacI/PurR family transcriptional regulator
MSESVPRPESLAERATVVLRKRIGEGRYGDTLPGEPRLSAELMIARGTLRKALGALTREGWISPGVAGTPRRITLASGASRRRGVRTVGVLTPQPFDILSAATQHFLRDLAALTAGEGITFVHHHSAATRQDRPGRLLKALLAEHPADLWLIYEASIPVARFFRDSGTPAIVCGGPTVNEGLSTCGFDGLAALRHAIGVFSRAGHTRIIAPTRYPRPRREQVFHEEFAKRGLAFDPKTHMPCWNSVPDLLHDLLCSRLSAPDRPTAWIVNGLEGLVVVFSTCLELGLRIPNDISLLTIGSDPMLSCFRPAISHYSTPHRALALAMAKMIRSHLQSPPPEPVTKLLQTEFVAGGSVGPAP